MAQKFLFILLIKISILIFISMLFFVTKIINRENAKVSWNNVQVTWCNSNDLVIQSFLFQEISIQEKFQDNKIRIDVRKKFEMNTNEPMNNVQIERKLLRGHRVKRAARENQWKNEYAKRQVNWFYLCLNSD